MIIMNDSRHSVPDVRKKTFYESGRSRRPDDCGTIEMCFSTHIAILVLVMCYSVQVKLQRRHTTSPLNGGLVREISYFMEI